jgi:hypothetical protein
MSRTEPLTKQDERIVAAAEADLQRLLSIEPSPEFATRVRVRIHERREPHATRWAWFGVAIATAAAVILAAMLRTNHSSPAGQRVEIAGRPDTTLRAAPPSEPGPSPSTTSAAHSAAIRKQPTRTAAAPATPEIIVDPAMTEAIRRMAMSLRNTEADASVAKQLQIEMGEPAPLAIAEPLNVPELVLKPADENGGNQTR